MAQHQLNLHKGCKPIRQKLRRFHPLCREVIKDEVDKLLVAGFIKEIQYLKWLANVVVVPKKNGKWHVCVDYFDLNDSYSGYNQIPMFQPDSVNKAFITSIGMYCYNVMSFGLKNTGATY